MVLCLGWSFRYVITSAVPLTLGWVNLYRIHVKCDLYKGSNMWEGEISLSVVCTRGIFVFSQPLNCHLTGERTVKPWNIKTGLKKGVRNFQDHRWECYLFWARNLPLTYSLLHSSKNLGSWRHLFSPSQLHEPRSWRRSFWRYFIHLAESLEPVLCCLPSRKYRFDN